jgi:hypothetical protein
MKEIERVRYYVSELGKKFSQLLFSLSSANVMSAVTEIEKG